MCQRVQCPKCKQPTFVGCGAHVEQVLRGVPAEERCHCREDHARDRAARGETGKGSWLHGLFAK